MRNNLLLNCILLADGLSSASNAKVENQDFNKWVCKIICVIASDSEAISKCCDEPHAPRECFVSRSDPRCGQMHNQFCLSTYSSVMQPL